MTGTVRVVLNETDAGCTSVDLDFDSVVLVGYSGRDRGAVEAHSRELERLGVAPPARGPALYSVSPALVSTSNSLLVAHPQTSGEAEFVLLPSQYGVLIGAGSDHTDRVHEAIDVAESKAKCGKVLSQEVWSLSALEQHWDSLELRAWTTDTFGRRLYQEGQLATLLTPAQLLAEVEAAGLATTRAVIFSGTLATIGGFAFGSHFEVELFDPVLNRRLRCAYAVNTSSAAGGGQ
jgi:hypothetical protein